MCFEFSASGKREQNISLYMSRVMREPILAYYAKAKVQISCAVTAQLISAFVFATIPLLYKTEISSLHLSRVAVRTLLEISKTIWFSLDAAYILTSGDVRKPLLCICQQPKRLSASAYAHRRIYYLFLLK